MQILITTGIAQPTATFRSLEPKFGNGNDGNFTVSSVLDVDVMRAKVTNISVGAYYSGNTWPYEYVITHNKAHGSWSNGISIDEDNVVLLHQSYQPDCQDPGDYLTTQSAHIFAWVSHVNATADVITIRTNIPLTNTLIPIAITANDQVQIIRINNWNNLTFNANSGFKCAAWDGETGGIMTFLVAGTLTFAGNNITFDVSEKGFAKGTRDNNVSNNVTVVTSAPGTALNVNATGGGGTYFSQTPNLTMTLIGDGNDGEGGKGREPDEELPGGKRNGSDYTTDFNTENVKFVNGVNPEPPLGINDELIEFKVFPNPANQHLSIDLGLLKDKELQELRVFSVEGKEINSFNYTEANGFIELEDLQNLEKGNYIVQLTIENKAYAISFVKE